MTCFRKNLLILYILIPLTILAWLVFPCPAGAEQAAPSSESVLTAETSDPGNPVSQALVNMINNRLDPSVLESYPLDPHPLEEYGESVRVRYLSRDTEDEPSYLVYREDLYLIPQEEAAAYSVTKTEDGRTAVISPALPEGAAEGKTGIVLLGKTFGEDTVLLFDGEPVRTETSLTVTLPVPEDISLNRIFSDGQFTDTMLSAPSKGASPAQQALSARRFYAAGPSSPLRGILPSYDITKDIDETNVTGNVSYNTNDFKLNVSFHADPSKLDFGLNIKLGARMYFDLTTSGAVARTSLVKLDIPLYCEEIFGVSLHYQVRTTFNSVPVHVKGHIDNSVNYVFGLIGATFQDYKGPVTFETAELVYPERDKNKEARFTIGSELSTSLDFLELGIDLVFYEFKIGPVFKVSFDLSADTQCSLILHKDEAFSPDRSDECIHECSLPGHEGCYTLNTSGSKSTKVRLTVDLYFKSWSFAPYDLGSSTGSKSYYNSLEHGTGFLEGECPYLLYRIPVEGREGREDSWLPAAGFTVLPSGNMPDIDPGLQPYTKDVTDANGRAVVYLPCRDAFRYTLVASDPSNTAGFGTQPHDMRKGGNETVIIYVNNLDTFSFLVFKEWEIDADGQDMPTEQPVFIVQELDLETNRWKTSLYQNKPVTIRLEYMNRRWQGSGRSLPMYRRQADGTKALMQYRVRELSRYPQQEAGESIDDYCARLESLVVFDRDDPEWNGRTEMPTVSYRVPAYMASVSGELVPEHQEEYLVNYDTSYNYNGSMTITVTNTAVKRIDVCKLWDNIPEEERPDHIYAALQTRPEQGWLSYAESQGVASGWRTVTDALSGPVFDLNRLIATGEMNVEVTRLKEGRFAIAELTPENSWSTSWMVRKYEKGIPMTWQASELDESIAQIAILQQYGFQVEARMAEKEYESIPGKALSVLGNWELTAGIVNTKEKKGQTIGGVKYWAPTSISSRVIPESIVIVVTDTATGEEAGRVTVSGPRDGDGLLMWPWSLTSESLDPDGVYEIREELPAEAAGKYICTVDGYNLVNTWIGDTQADIRIRKVWDPLYLRYVEKEHGEGALPPTSPQVRFTAYGQSSYYTLSEDNGFEWLIEDVALSDPNDPMDPGKFSIKETGIPRPLLNSLRDSSFIPVYSGPELTFENGKRVYTFTVANMLQFEYSMSSVYKNWDFGMLNESDAVIPDSVTIELLRNGEPVGDAVTSGRHWLYDYFGKLLQPATLDTYRLAREPLMRLDPEGRLYRYSIRETMDPETLLLTTGTETHTGGYTYTVDTYNTWDETGLRYSVTNHWIPGKTADELVTVRGTKRWQTEPYPASAALRPDCVYVYILDSKDELAGMAECEYDSGSRTWVWSAKNLPRYDENGEQISYHIQEKHTDGYTAFYDEPVFDEASLTWTCDMENRLSFAYMTVNKRILDGKPDPSDTFSFKLTFFGGYTSSDSGAPKVRSDRAEILGEGSARFDFLLNDEGVYIYLLKEEDGGDPKYNYSTSLKLVILVVKRDNAGLLYGDFYLIDENTRIDTTDTFEELLKQLPDGRFVTFINYIQTLMSVEKKWDIDLEDKDRPDSIRVVVQKKVPYISEERWETVAAGTLNAQDGWKTQIGVPKPKEANPQYRVRELATDRSIVFAPDDADNPDQGSLSYVTFPVPEYESTVAGGRVEAHYTRYLVSYGKEDDTFTITDTAVTQVDVAKRWILLDEEEEKPDSAWVALLSRPKAGSVQNAQGIPGADLSGLADTETPVFGLVSGGINPADLVGELALGVSADIFGAEDGLNVAIAKVSEENNWTAHFVDRKYTRGIPVEYTGVELDSGVVRQVIKHAAGFNLAVTFNPFDNYISIPGKARRSFGDWSLADLDASVLEKLQKAGKTLTDADLEPFRADDAFLSDWKLLANVINVQIDPDNPPDPGPDPQPDPSPLTVVKRWVNDSADRRPDTLTIHVRDAEKNEQGIHAEAAGSPFTMNKADFAGLDEWSKTLPGTDGTKEYQISEEYPEGFANRDHYTGEVVDAEIINTWNEEEVTTVRVSGQKTWDDKDNQAKKRPKRITVELLADGEPAARPVQKNGRTVSEPVSPVETSEEGGWKYFFTDLPRYKTVDGEKKEIRYSVKEKEVREYTAEYAEPVFDETTRNWDCDITNKLDGYGELTIEKTWDIDLEGNDHPKSIEVLVQKKTGSGDDEKWESVKLVELTEDNKDGLYTWKTSVCLPLKQKKEGSENETEDIVYRVRELKAENGILKILKDKIKEYAGQVKDRFDEWMDDIKTNAKDLFDNLPEPLKDAANESFDKLAEELDAKKNEVYQKLLEKMEFYSAETRIVYDKDDKDKPKKGDGDDKEPETNIVSFKVEEYTTLAQETVDAHETKYKVSYKVREGEEGKGATYSIGNQSILEVDVVKRWILLGDAKEEDKPENVYLALLFKVDEKVAGKAADYVDLDSLTDIELPVFNLFDHELFTSGLISGGMNPITLVSELIVGVDIDIFDLGDKLLTVAIAKVNADDDWTAHFVVSKYMFGIPVEYKGAELGSEVIRQVVKYLLHVDMSVSYEPFGNFISIPGKAYGNLLDVSQIGDLFNLDDSSIAGKLAGEALEFVIGKLNDLIKEIAPAGTPVGLDDWEQVANVINIKIGIDLPDYTSVRKIWVNDQEADRPEWIKLQVKATRKDGTTEDKEVTLEKEDFTGHDEWSVELNQWEKDQEENGNQNGENENGSEEGEDDDGDDENPITEAEITAETFPDGYDSSIYERKIDGPEVTNTRKVPGEVSISGRKVWEDENDRDHLRPETLTIRLLADGVPVTKQEEKKNEQTGETETETVEVTVTTSAAGNWKYFFPKLPEKDGQGQPITYTVEETEVPDGYTSAGGTKAEGYNITNTHKPETLDEVTVKKVWDDDNDRDGIRPEKVSVTLLANGATPTDLSPATPTDLSEANGWEHTFTDLYKYEDGQEIEYTADETEVPDGYEKSLDGLTVTNRHEPERVDVTVKKIWDDGDDADGIRPEKVTVSLATATDLSPANLATPTDLTEANGWEHTFTGMLKNHEGQEIHYRAEEEEVPDGYTKSVDGLTITNTHEYEKITVRGVKTWDDADDADGLRPDQILVYLIAYGRVIDVKQVEPDDRGEWTFSFENVPKNRKGEPIPYAVAEEPVPGYASEVTGNLNDGFTIVNTHEQDSITVYGEKIWDDADDQDGKRPEDILVTLFWKGVPIDNRSVSELTGWKYNFPNIPRNYAGSAADWEISEYPLDDARGYEDPEYSPVSSPRDGVYELNITNRHVPEEIDVTVEKSWDDDGDRDGIRPDSVTLSLYADGVKLDGREAVLNKGTGWQYTFTGMPKYANGREIVYSASENQVPEGYTMIPSGTRVTNIHVPETVTISGRKYWDDADDHDGLRPDEITVILSADDREADSRRVTAADDWAYSFTVPKYEAGAEISYKVSEEAVENYSTVISGYDITNTHVPERITISGEKDWQDGQDQDGLRPDSVTIGLYADGVRVYKKTLRADAEGRWKYSFPNMPKYRDGGGEIVYSVAEETVSGYYFIPSGMNIANIHVPETMTVSGEKYWDDDDDRDAIRPEEITVTLSAEGMEPLSQTVTADEEGRWRYTFWNVPVYNNGQKLTWMISESPIPAGYRMVVSGWNITNVHVPEKLAVSGIKIWNDYDDQDDIRPDEVTVVLLADGSETQRTSVTAENGWQYRFTGLDILKDGREITYTVTEDPVPAGYTATVNGFDITNQHLPETADISGEKTWDDDDDRDAVRPDKITVTLSAEGMEPLSQTVTADKEGRWRYTFHDLPMYKNGQKIAWTVSESPIPAGYRMVVSGRNITNVHVPEKLAVSGTKTWDDDDDRDGIRPDEVTVILLADGSEAQRATVSAENGWQYRFTGLDILKDGEEITYTVTEDPVPEGYTATVNGFDITNQHLPETADISGEKAWDDDDDRDAVRPDKITVTLSAEGMEPLSQTVTADEEGRWRYTFRNVPVYHNGQKLSWTISESPIPAGYTATVNGFDITNKHLPEKLAVSGTKTWDDDDDRDGIRPDTITVVLMADGSEVRRATVSAESGWQYRFTGLDILKDGEEITYTVTEDPVPEGYTATVNGFDITNTHLPEKLAVSGTKTWDDDDDRDGIRPDEVTVVLLADGSEVRRATVSAESGWQYRFTGLEPLKDGKEITYTVTEDPVPEGYTATVNGFDIINTHLPEKLAVSGTKTWDDDDDRDGIRPDEVTVVLLADGSEVRRSAVTAENGWQYRFTGLEPLKDGREITYTVTEDPVPEGYTATVNGFDITNKHLPGTIDISGKKSWDDDDRDGLRPDAITVVLLADGNEVRRATVSAENGWQYRFTGLEPQKDGREITYTVTEDPVPAGYTATVNGFDITNTRLPDTIDISGKKSWDDDDDRDGLRPDAITVVLLADGNEARRATVSAENGWQYRFTGLEPQKDGREITYTVTEDPVPAGYTATVNGFDITNTRLPDTIDISGKKSWDDDDDRDGLRPDAITVVLLADGSEVRRATVTAENGWQYSFTGLDARKDGKEITYTVTEDPVPEGYTATVNGFDITNTRLPDTVDISGKKSWDDDDDRDGIRPDEVTVVLLADGRETDRRTVSWTDGWQYSFTGLDARKDGKEITYTVAEDPVPEGYTAAVSGFNIINRHTPETVDISGQKIWEDDGDRNGLRPDAITVILLADGEEVKRVSVTAADNWRYSFTGLKKFSDAREISYTVSELPAGMYDTAIDGYDIINTLQQARYTVEWYYQKDGVYPDTPNVAEERSAVPGETVSVTDEDRIPGRERYMPDGHAANIFSGTAAADGSLKLKIYFCPYYLITFDPNGGTLDGSTEPVSTAHLYGEMITIREAPVRDGYDFQYWEGSRYDPGDTYTVTEDHTFVARWKKETPPPGPYRYRFTFTKKWSGAHGDSIDWTLYDQDGKVVHKKFNKTVVSDNEWRYEAWFESDRDYYIVENVPQGFKARYENTGVRANETDCCYNGGTIINYKIPKTRDNTNLPLWTALSLLGLLGTALTVRRIRRKKR